MSSGETPDRPAALRRLPVRMIIAFAASLDMACVLSATLLLAETSPVVVAHSSAYWGCLLASSAAIWLLAAQFRKLYSPEKWIAGQASWPAALQSCAIAFALLLGATRSVAFVGGGASLRSALVLACCIGGILAAHRLAALVIASAVRRGRCLEAVLVLGGSEAASRIVAAEIEAGLQRRIGVAAHMAVPGTPEGPPMAWLEEAIRSGRVDRVVIADVVTGSPEYNATMACLRRLCVDITLVPSDLALLPVSLRAVRLGYLSGLDVSNRPFAASSAALKYGVDIVLAITALLLTAPISLLVACAIKLESPGPALFRQKRAGLNGRIFTMYKFRTMYVDMEDEPATKQTTRNDPRITKVGRLLRRTSIDELPQLVNVITRDMSLVGPRPHALGMIVDALSVEEVIEGYGARHRVKPGLTGLAQVSGSRGAVDTPRQLRRRYELDCDYIENWSMLKDFWIMLRTVALIFYDRQAF